MLYSNFNQRFRAISTVRCRMLLSSSTSVRSLTTLMSISNMWIQIKFPLTTELTKLTVKLRCFIALQFQMTVQWWRIWIDLIAFSTGVDSPSDQCHMVICWKKFLSIIRILIFNASNQKKNVTFFNQKRSRVKKISQFLQKK